MGDGNNDFEVPMLSDSGKSFMLRHKICSFYFSSLINILPLTYTANFFHKGKRTCHIQLSFPLHPFSIKPFHPIQLLFVEDYLQKLENCCAKIKPRCLRLCRLERFQLCKSVLVCLIINRETIS